jgi:hypothetical protein
MDDFDKLGRNLACDLDGNDGRLAGGTQYYSAVAGSPVAGCGRDATTRRGEFVGKRRTSPYVAG